MQKIRVLLASRPKILSEVLRNMIERQPDMQLVGAVIDPIELLIALRAMAVDVVIVMPLDTEGEPRICSHLLREHQHLKIVTVSAKSETASLYQSGSRKTRIDEPSEPSILGAIRESIQLNSKEKQP
jgi:DNA-binding NarL/FixJ family response regulator